MGQVAELYYGINKVRASVPSKEFSRLTEYHHGKFTKENLPIELGEGDYTIDVSPSVKHSLVVNATRDKPLAFTIKAGQRTTLSLDTTPAATMKGRVVEHISKQPIPNFEVNIYHIKNNSAFAIGNVTTDANGYFTAFVPAGLSLRAGRDDRNALYIDLPQVESTTRESNDIILKPGEVRVIPDVAFDKAVTLSGTVVNEEGQPVPHADIFLPYQGHHQRVYSTKADASGRFQLQGFLPDAAVESPRFRLGAKVSQPSFLDLNLPQQEMKVLLSEKQAGGVQGLVTSLNGKPLAGATVNIQWRARGSGRFRNMSTDRTVASITTDSAGQFKYAGLWLKDHYHVTVSAEGYSQTEPPSFNSVPGKPLHDLGTIKLTRVSAIVRGSVIDSAGKPLAGVTLHQRGDGPVNTKTLSAADGSFTLPGYYETKGFVFAENTGYRLSYAFAQPDGDAVVVTMRRVDESSAYQPSMPAGHQAAVDQMYRYLLESLWKQRTLLGGYEHSVFRAMVQFDLPRAKVWMNEAGLANNADSFYEQSLKYAARRAMMSKPDQHDMDELLDVMREGKDREAFIDMLEIGKQLLKTNKAKALQVVEEATLKARAMESPERIWSMAMVGRLAEQAGNAAGGKALILEAADLAEKATNEGRDTLARGYVARYLARHDLPRAEKLIEKMSAGAYNRWIGHLCYELATHDFKQARQLFDKIKSSDSLGCQYILAQMAFHVVNTKPEQAEQLIREIEKDYLKSQTLGKLAELVSTRDQTRAVRWINDARKLYDSPNRDDFRSTGGAAKHAMTLVFLAHRAGYPEMGDIVLWALMQRPEARGAYDQNDRYEQIFAQTMLLSLIDPVMAQKVLATLAPDDQLVQLAATGPREWFFGLALAHPSLGMKAIDRKIEQIVAQSNRNTVSNTGLIEFISIVTDLKRLKLESIRSFGSFMWVPEDPN
jgi:protocatechuate 3,4-dioxygenase beta subunit